MGVGAERVSLDSTRAEPRRLDYLRHIVQQTSPTRVPSRKKREREIVTTFDLFPCFPRPRTNREVPRHRVQVHQASDSRYGQDDQARLLRRSVSLSPSSRVCSRSLSTKRRHQSKWAACQASTKPGTSAATRSTASRAANTRNSRPWQRQRPLSTAPRLLPRRPSRKRQQKLAHHHTSRRRKQRDR